MDNSSPPVLSQLCCMLQLSSTRARCSGHCLVVLQDTPAVISSYSAAVRVPAALTALMSAVPCEGPPQLPSGGTAPEGVPHLADVHAAAEDATKVFYFLQKVPVPSYLIALAVGELESRELSDRWVRGCSAHM